MVVVPMVPIVLGGLISVGMVIEAEKPEHSDWVKNAAKRRAGSIFLGCAAISVMLIVVLSHSAGP